MFGGAGLGTVDIYRRPVPQKGDQATALSFVARRVQGSAQYAVQLEENMCTGYEHVSQCQHVSAEHEHEGRLIPNQSG